MTMEYRHALDDRISEVQDDIRGAAIRNIHGIKPHGMRERDPILGVGQEMDLVYVEGMEFGGRVENTPMLISTYANASHRTRLRRGLAAVDDKAVFVYA